MKKYLITAALAVAISGAFVSCNDDFISDSLIEQKAKAFDEAFIKAFGTPAPNHTWGFANNNITEGDVITRTVHKRDPEQGFDYDHEPAPVTEAEAAYVYQWFKDNEGLTERGLDWDTFYLQQVYGTMDQKKQGLWNYQGQGDQTFEDYGGMDYLILTDNNGYEEHVNDFNAEEGGPFGIVYMTNSSALYFGYHGSWDNSDRQLFKLAQITVPGYCFGEGEADRTAYYVGLSLYGEKSDNGPKRLGEQRYNWGDDWILKVVPGVSTPQGTVIEHEEIVEAGRVFCEDLGGADDLNDVDYNDIVFDAIVVREWKKVIAADNSETTVYDRKYAKVCLLAAGGTIPSTVAGHQVHNELSEGNYYFPLFKLD